MRDDELNKKFELNPISSTIKINNHVINPADVDGNISISLPVSNCYCLCLSNRKNDVELFEKFKADVCLEIDVIELVSFLKAALQNFPGIAIEHRQVHYYALSSVLLEHHTSSPRLLVTLLLGRYASQY